MRFLIASIVLFQHLLLIWYADCQTSRQNLFNLDEFSEDEIKDSNVIKQITNLNPNKLDISNKNDYLVDYLSELKEILSKYKNYDMPLSNGPIKRSRLIKKTKPITHNGYSLDINVENFKSFRYCHFNEPCKNRYKPYFECVCPLSTLCTGQGSLFEGKCSNHLMPYVWLQNADEANIKTNKNKM